MKRINCNANLGYCFKQPFKNLNETISLNHEPELYEPITREQDHEYFRNDWAVLAFRAFKIIKSHLKKEIKSFCTVGTGIGLDVLGAVEAFSPEQVVLTDINEAIAMKACINVGSNLKKREQFKIKPIGADILDGQMKFSNLKFDLIYENLPNLPEENAEHNCQPFRASFINFSQYSYVPGLYKKYLLPSHYVFLNQASQHLAPNGAVLCNIGGRVPFEIIEKMFSESGFVPKVLLFDIKKQNESKTNLPVYALWEQMGNTTFSFYPYYEVLNFLNSRIKYDKLSGYANCFGKINEMLKYLEMSANEAYLAYKKGNEIAHSVYTIYAVRSQNVMIQKQKILVK
jgi:methylase of polypeptide subunit release factors